MTFEELSTKSVVYQEWYTTIGYLDANWCRQRADDWCEQLVILQVTPPVVSVNEPNAALMLTCGLIALAIYHRLHGWKAVVPKRTPWGVLRSIWSK